MRQNITIPSPSKGWNTVDSVTDIPPNMAITLDNFFPTTSNVVMREGYSSFATGMGSSNVDSLFELRGAGITKLIAATDGKIYDVTSGGTASLLSSGYTNDQWQGTVFNGILALVNGADTPQQYNGTSVTTLTLTGIVDPSQVNDVITFKGRMYFTVNNSQSFWYSELNTLGGALTEFPLGRVGNFGGNILAIRAITKDGGSGQDDNLCFFMSTGEVIIYQGTNPATDFVLIGVFNSGRPLTSRAIVKFGPDIMSVTNDGYTTLSSLLPLSFGKTNDAINQYIKGAAGEAAAEFPNSFGWQVIVSPENNFLLVNVPQSAGAFVQHVLNVNTLAWCRFTGINSRCWVNFGNNLYFGGTDGVVYKYGSAFTDDNNLIEATYQTPFLSFSNSGGITRTTAFRPLIRIDARAYLTISSSSDFKDFTTPYTLTYPIIGADWGDPWGTFSGAPDWGFPWGTSWGFLVDRPWATSTTTLNYFNLNSFSYKTSVKLVLSSGGRLTYYQTDFLTDQGNRI